jgi:hypothetical protein
LYVCIKSRLSAVEERRAFEVNEDERKVFIAPITLNKHIRITQETDAKRDTRFHIVVKARG